MARGLGDRMPQVNRRQAPAWRCLFTYSSRKAIVAMIAISVFFGMYWMSQLESKLSESDRRMELTTEVSRRPPEGTAVRFRPVDLLRGMQEQSWRMNRLRSEERTGIRHPKLALVVRTMAKDPETLMMLTILKGLKELRYSISVFALADGEARFLYEHLHCEVLILHSEVPAVDWSNYEGIILSSLESQRVIPSLMQHPFNSIPVIWLVQEDTLGGRLSLYEENNLNNLVTIWRGAFGRANVVVFPDFSLLMMYNSLDTGNFYVIPGFPVNVWEAKIYSTSHSRHQLRKANGFGEDNLIIVVIGSYFFYNDLPWEYAATTNSITPAISKFARKTDLRESIKLLFVCGNSVDNHDSALQELASQMGLPVDAVKHYGVDEDVNGLLLMSDIALYGSFHDEQSFPPLLLRAMSFGIPVVVPNLDIIRKYIVDQEHGLIFNFNSDTLVRALSLLIKDKKLSELAYKLASSGKLFAANMLASDCVADYAKLLENVLQFPSDVMLPLNVRHVNQKIWVWDLIEKETGKSNASAQQNGYADNVSIVERLEAQMHDPEFSNNTKDPVIESSTLDFPSQSDWDALSKTEILEDYDRREMEEIEDRTYRNLGSWEELYQKARKADKQSYNFDNYERDESELEKIGQQLCIYEIYSGNGTWPFLHHDSLYRGISLYNGARRSVSDDVDAAARLPLLKNPYYIDLLCELGAMFSIANKVDSIHTIPWIGFQPWQAAGRKVSLSVTAEDALEHAILENSEGDVIYFWASMNIRNGREDINFWSLCDILNAGNCRTVFEESFRLMYGLPKDMAALPPMPDDGNKWSTLHCWVMPTSSFLEFMMFSRMFVDSLDYKIHNSTYHPSCTLGFSDLEKKHCYCRVLDMLVNVWAYHSGRKMVYLDPTTGETKEQHPLEQRIGHMWVKYFDSMLLKSMDEDLAEEADDGMHPNNDRWLWPLTGEVHWQGILDREREERYRVKKDKKMKNAEKLLERHTYGTPQKPLGGKT